MTVSSLIPVNNYTGNSSNKQFDFDFLIEDVNELVVTYTSETGQSTILKAGIDYSVHEIGNPLGSYIIFPIIGSTYSVLGTGERLSLALDLAIKQESEFKNSSYFNFNVLEWTFDYIVRILQIMNRRLERAIKVQEGADITTDELALNLIRVANDLTNIDSASEYANLAKDWANKMTGSVDGSEFSAKYYAQQAANGQIQTNWNEVDSTSKSYIQNKPFNTIGTNLTVDNGALILSDGFLENTVFHSSSENPTLFAWGTDMYTSSDTPSTGDFLYDRYGEKLYNNTIGYYYVKVYDSVNNKITWINAASVDAEDGCAIGFAFRNSALDVPQILKDNNGDEIIISYADRDLCNLSAIGAKVMDGDWNDSSATLIDHESYPSSSDKSIDLSSYLPNDGCKYEIKLRCGCTTGNSSGDMVAVRLVSDLATHEHYMCGIRTRVSDTIITFTTGSIAVGNDRYIKVKASNTYEGTYTIIALGYRRIGTNI